MTYIRFKVDILKRLEEENSNLKNELKKLHEETQIKDEIFIQQAKMASMGEMINNIAHQWRQPLMEISTLLMKTEAKIKLTDEISKPELLSTIEQSNNVLRFMSQTIEDFRNFFATNKIKEDFFITAQISSVLNILNSTLQKSNIKVDVIIKNNIKFHGYKNEYAQVLMNIISNANDAIISNKIKNGKITIKLYQKEGRAILEIEDNGGGIQVTPIEDVFKPFFTYKKKNGTGVGLFMSKLIIENNLGGTLQVTNKNSGALFTIKV